MKVKCVKCGKEYGLSDGENVSDFTCECGGTLEERRGISDVRTVDKSETKPEDTEIKETKYCSNCAEEIDHKAEICPKCGVRQAGYSTQVNEKKNPLLALILSFILTGLGQIYNGHTEKGLILLVGNIILIVIVVVLTFFIIGIFLSILPFFVWVFSMYDAYVSADRMNKGLPVKERLQDYFS